MKAGDSLAAGLGEAEGGRRREGQTDGRGDGWNVELGDGIRTAGTGWPRPWRRAGPGGNGHGDSPGLGQDSPDKGSFIFGGSRTLGGGSGAASPAGTTLSAREARRGLGPRPSLRKASLRAASPASSSPWARAPCSLARRPKSAELRRVPGISTRPRKERGCPSPGLPARRPGVQARRKGARPASFSSVGRRPHDVPLGRVPSRPGSSSSSPGTSSKGFREDLWGRVPARGTLASATRRLFRMGILPGRGPGGEIMGR